MSSSITYPELVPCRFCHAQPSVELCVGEGEGENRIYVFAIRHSCGGFQGGHFSVFFQNDTAPDKCHATLQRSATIYATLWNQRHGLQNTEENDVSAQSQNR